ncbi:hypothetical protein [Fictibacillus terranigra]|uniref:Uncharacterized protein n=1 Tax=Fictibacillus terranigra TaxID=3058424 RepID=A0ABT8ECC1_9BACL|nr:hypothetical protein [Fictibacillus sp. CENA-BCM004]MDN4075554.1 hypothetical protein [Fictibacillus sp. CENA-BCM004]
MWKITAKKYTFVSSSSMWKSIEVKNIKLNDNEMVKIESYVKGNKASRMKNTPEHSTIWLNSGFCFAFFRYFIYRK